MKNTLYPLGAAAVLLALASPLHTEEPKITAVAPVLAPTPAVLQGKWNVRVEVLMVALPEEKALALLPDLLDDTKINAACAYLMEAIQRKEARLTGYPIATGLDGQEAHAETRLEKIYPTQFEAPQMPTAFEYRRMGPQLQAKCQVSSGGDSIQLLVQVQRNELLGFDFYDTGLQNKDGASAKIGQPIFFDPSVATTLGVHNGQRILLAIHKLIKPDGEMEFFILQATATALP